MKEALHSHPSDFRYRDLHTGMAHSHIRWTAGEPPTPYGCRWCGTEHAHHGMQYLRSRGVHVWEEPTQAQILARMRARRTAFKSTCRCEHPWLRVDPYRCEADDCFGVFPELNPFSGGRPVWERSANVSRLCTVCGWRTSVWHVDDGSADVELKGHVMGAHGGYGAKAGERS